MFAGIAAMAAATQSSRWPEMIAPCTVRDGIFGPLCLALEEHKNSDFRDADSRRYHRW